MTKHAAIAGRGGFTLFEVLVVLGIMSVVTGLGTVSFFGLTDAWHDAQTLVELDGVAKSALDSLEEDFSDALSAKLSGVPLRGLDRTAEDQRYFDRVLEDDKVVIPVQTTRAGHQRLEGSTVMYQVMRNANQQVLVRTIGDLDTEFPMGGRLNVMDSDRANLIRFNLEYQAAGSSEWVDEWLEPELPRSVRVSLVVADSYRSHLQVARKAVFPIHVR